MCDCIKKIHEKLKSEIHGRFSKPNKPVRHFNIRTNMSGQVIVNINISLENQIKQIDSFIVADFCPWCGNRYKTS